MEEEERRKDNMGKIVYLKQGETKCPICGSTHICEISRITGYLSFDERFCESKTKERKDRVAHNIVEDK